MTAKRQMREIELRRRIRNAIAALKAVDSLLEQEAGSAPLSPDRLADRIRDNVKAAISRGKDH